MIINGRLILNRKLLLYSIAGVFILVCLFLLINYLKYLNYGTIQITSLKNRISVSIYRIENSSNKYIESVYTNYSGQLPSGNYQIYATGQNNTFIKNVYLKAKSNTFVSIKFYNQIQPEPIYSESASNIYSDGKNLSFVDPSSNYLYGINSQNNLSILNDQSTFLSVKWITYNSGLAEGKDNNLYYFNNNSLNKVTLPFSTQKNPSFSFDCSSNGVVYVSNGQTVYVGSVKGNFQQIYSSGNNYNTSVSAGNGNVAILEYANNTSRVVIVGNSKHIINLPAKQISWSPDDKLLLVNTGGQNTAIYSSDLKLITTLGVSQISDAVWSDNNQIVFLSKGSIWLYNLTTQTEYLLATPNLPGATISDLSADTSGDNIFYNYTNTSNVSEVYRLSLSNQNYPQYVNELPIFFPTSVGIDSPCYIDYINFTDTSLFVTIPDSTSQAECQSEVDVELTIDGLSSYNLPINYSTIELPNGD